MDEPIAWYRSLAEFSASLGGDPLPESIITADRLEVVHPNTPMMSPRFRTNYYTFVLITGGTGWYAVDQYTYTTQPGTLYITNPGHLKGFALHEPCTGYLITTTDSFLTRCVHPDPFRAFPFLLAESAPPWYLVPERFVPFAALGAQLTHEMTTSAPSQAEIVGSLLHILLLKIKDHLWHPVDVGADSLGPSRIVTTFKHQLDSAIRQLLAGMTTQVPQVHDFALAQNLHPTYLGAVIKQHTGKSAHAWITDRVIAEAQALLLHTALTVQAIGDRLGFPAPGHFSRFFKTHTGTTPSNFRRAPGGVPIAANLEI